MDHENDDFCPACKKAKELGFTDEQAEAFHAVINSEIELANSLNDLEDTGVIVDEPLEDHVIQVLGEIEALQMLQDAEPPASPAMMH